MKELYSFLDSISNNSDFKAELSKKGGYVTFSNSGRRGGAKYFQIGLENILQTLRDILDHLDVFQNLTEYEEKAWRDNGSEFFTDPVANANSTVQTKPLFSTLSKIIIWGNQPHLKDIDPDQIIALDRNCIQQTIDKLEIVSDSFTPRNIVRGESQNGFTQQIYYGCPGSGKSYKVKVITNTINPDYVFRTTFHPDTDYASFVGCYKPITKCGKVLKRIDYSIDDLAAILKKNYEDADIKTVALHSFALEYADYFNGVIAQYNKKDLVLKAGLSEDYEVEINKIVNLFGWMKTRGYINTNDTIAYEFIPQTFTNAYIKAWEDTSKPVYLIIEEINRGNCAQIFGDLFQLLDRDKATGKSEYPIKADKDLVAHIEKVLGTSHEGIKNGELCLPPNLIIYATMNTSDQSLFPMDSAFKRRWDWEYVPINYSKDIDSGKFIIEVDEDTKYSWVEFLESVNDKIYDATNSEDKQMGNFFIKKSVKANEFVNKVMFYLWNEVCKEEYGTQRNFFRKGKEGKTEFKFTELFGDNQATILKEFMTSLGVEPIGKKPEEPAAE
ncbi:MAG: hypothetical protein IKJ59_09190 [Clostridia bacterium]|nr:hypothetical protein [Clostridia bacterium]